MPLTPGSPVGDTIRELHTGNTYAHTSEKFGKDRANKQAIAIAMSNARKGHAAGGVAGYDVGGGVDPVQQVINALSAGSSSTGAGTAGIGTSNPSAPSSAQSTAAVNAATSGLVNPSAAAMSSPSAMPTATPVTPTPTAAPTSGVAAIPNVTPTAQKLMAEGGGLGMAAGGFYQPPKPVTTQPPPYFQRQEMRGLHTGPVLSSVPGRTDKHALQVPSGSYVATAQHVASLGQGNTLAGMSALGKMFNMGPYGSSAPKFSHANAMPKPPKTPKILYMGGIARPMVESDLGGARGEDEEYPPVDVMLSGGEYVIPPWKIKEKYGPNLKNGHAVLDQWMMDTRKREIETQKKLPPPAKT